MLLDDIVAGLPSIFGRLLDRIYVWVVACPITLVFDQYKERPQ